MESKRTRFVDEKVQEQTKQYTKILAERIARYREDIQKVDLKLKEKRGHVLGSIDKALVDCQQWIGKVEAECMSKIEQMGVPTQDFTVNDLKKNKLEFDLIKMADRIEREYVELDYTRMKMNLEVKALQRLRLFYANTLHVPISAALDTSTNDWRVKDTYDELYKWIDVCDETIKRLSNKPYTV